MLPFCKKQQKWLVCAKLSTGREIKVIFIEFYSFHSGFNCYFLRGKKTSIQVICLVFAWSYCVQLWCIFTSQVTTFVAVAKNSVAESVLGVIEWYNHQGWKRPPRSSNPIFDRTPPGQLNHSIKFHVQPCLEHFQGCWLRHFPEQPLAMLDSPSIMWTVSVSMHSAVWREVRVLSLGRVCCSPVLRYPLE